MSARSTPAAAEAEPRGTLPRIVVAGIGQLWQGDFDLGRRAAERLAAEGLGPDVAVEDFSYGAVHVTWRLEELRPEALVVVAAERRGRAPGSVERREVEPPALPPRDAQLAIGDALTGYLSVDLLVEVGAALGALPPRIVVIEVEPASRYPSHELTRECDVALDRALDLVRDEVRRQLDQNRV